jgi:hypothetical protein
MFSPFDDCQQPLDCNTNARREAHPSACISMCPICIGQAMYAAISALTQFGQQAYAY